MYKSKRCSKQGTRAAKRHAPRYRNADIDRTITTLDQAWQAYIGSFGGLDGETYKKSWLGSVKYAYYIYRTSDDLTERKHWLKRLRALGARGDLELIFAEEDNNGNN